ncbi:MAG: YfhO family protein [Clostridia bacterium]|nr:YfhO family protein [Clostridia bacterium]
MKEQKNKTNGTNTAELSTPLPQNGWTEKKNKFGTAYRAIKSEYGYIWLGALIPAVIFFLIYLCRGLYPFGDGTVLVLDLNGQYVYFFEHLRNCVLEGDSLLYAWERALGGEFLGMYAYYIASPLSYLICLFPYDKTQEFLLFMFMLKAALCGGTMGFYLHKHSVNKNKLTVVAFSVLYAMSAYCVVQQNNTMWIDAVMWLPLVTYGVEQIVKYGKYKCFVIFLSLTILSNFYIGYMVCIFVFLYFFFFMLAYKDNNVNNPHFEDKHFLKSFVRIAFFSIIAVGISAVIILGAYYSLSFGKSEFTDPSWEITMRFDFFDLLFKLLPSSYDTVRIDGLPFIYCGLLTVILAPLFFCSKKFTAREKIVSAIFLLIFVFSFMISSVDLIWHGFQKPQWLNNRYSFMFCFFLVFLAFRAMDHIEEIKPKSIGCVSAFIFIFVVMLQQFKGQYEEKLQNLTYGNGDFVVHEFATVMLTIVCLVAYICIIAAMKSSKNKDLVATVLLVTVCIEAFFSGLCNINDLDEDVGYTEYQKYNEFNLLFRPVVDTLTEEYDTSFYRFEKTYHRKYNDNMALDIRGVSNSTSTLNKSTVNFLRMLGYYSQSHKSQYLGGNPATDSLIGLKYIISDRDLSSLYGDPVLTGSDYANYLGVTMDELREMTFADEYKDYTAEDLNVYYNPYALSLAFAASEDVFNVNMADHNSYVEEDDEKYNPEGYITPFERYNALITAILGEDETVEIFKPAAQNGSPSLSGATATESSGHYKYKGDGGKITYSYSVPENTMLYLFLPAHYNREIKLSSDTVKIFDGTTKLSKCNDRIVELGYVEGNDYSFTVTISNSRDEFYTKIASSYIYYIDMELLEEVMTKLQSNQLILDEEYEEHDISGTITTDNDGQLILTTIPYDEGWNVYVDGKKVEVTQAADALLSFTIEDSGEHTVRFKYRSKAYSAGLVITLICLAAFVLIIVFEKKLKRIAIVKRYFDVPKLSDPNPAPVNVIKHKKK